MSNAAERRPLTYDEFLRAERASAGKHEFVGGEVYAMAGARRRHNLIAMDLALALGLQLRGRPCELYASDMRVRTPDDVAAYPDLSALCGEPQFSDPAREDELLNPSLVVEVLSETTEAYDRGEKFEHYRTLTSLREYVLVASDRVGVDVFVRQEDGAFLLRHYRAGEAFPLPSIGCTVQVDDVYAKSGLTAR